MRITLLMAIQCFASVSTAQIAALEFPDSGAPLGIGWNSTRAQTADAYCVEFERMQEPAQIVITEAKRFRLTDTLLRNLGSSLEFGARATAGVSASSRTEFATTQNRSLEDQSFSVMLRVKNAVETASPTLSTPLRLKQEYVDLLKQPDGATKFVHLCGDSFVFRRYGGAELISLITVSNLSEEERQSVRFSAGGSGVVLSLSGSLNTEENRARVRNQTTFSYWLFGGSGSTAPVDESFLNAAIAEVPKLARDSPKLWQIEVRRYDDLSNWPRDVSLGSQKRSLGLAHLMYERVSQIDAVALRARANPAEYISASIFPADLDRIVAQSREILNELKTGIEQCLKSEDDCTSLPKSDRLDYYWAYSRLPLRRGANEHDRKIIEQERMLASLVESRQRVFEELERIFFRRPTCELLLTPPPPHKGRGVRVTPPIQIHPKVVEAIQLCREEILQQRRLSELKSAEVRHIREAVILRWISSISDESCSLDRTHSLCLTGAQLASKSAEIRSRRYGICLEGGTAEPCVSADPLFGLLTGGFRPWRTLGSGARW